jgi:hypothetical protein
MKNLLFLLVLLIVLPTQAQLTVDENGYTLIGDVSENNIKMFPEGRKWYIGLWDCDDEYNVKPDSLIVSGDTMVAGKKCKKIYHNNHAEPELIVYEEGKSVYAYSPETQTFVLRMDFALNKGDEIREDFGEGYYITRTVIEKDSVYIDGVVHCRLTISPGLSYEDLCYWVEGIGASCEVWCNTIEDSDNIRPISAFYFMISCFDSDRLIFTRDDFAAKNTGVKGIVPTSSCDVSHIYDTSGRVVRNLRKGNIYIRHGKKFVK